jgi:hypothetical protein
MASLRVALVHDWLTGMRGGEKVLLELCRLFPGAPVYTLLHTVGSVDPEIEARAPRTSWLQRLPGARRGYRNYLPLFPAAIRSLRLEPVDLVVSTSHAVAKGVRCPPGAVHVSYIHTPMRYLWDTDGQYFRFGRLRLAKRLALGAVSPYLRRFDLAGNRGVDWFHLEIGEIAVVIAAAAPHRAEAFDACRFAIDTLKQTVPIWKKEVATDGEYWVDDRP